MIISKKDFKLKLEITTVTEQYLHRSIENITT